ncbi:MAG: trimethylamine methyltransferase family protein, partial [Chloroflexota bacterium]
MTTREPRRRAARKPTAIPPGQEGGQYQPLSQADVHRIHEAALTVLERTGVEVFESECRAILEANGARVDKA